MKPISEKLAIILVGCLLLSSNLEGEETARYYDATHYKKSNEELNLHQHVRPMLMIYESDIFSDRKSVRSHMPENAMPDGDRFIRKLQEFPNYDVMVDIESLNGKASETEKLNRIAYITEVMKSIRSQAKVLGLDDRKWFWYGAAYTPRAYLDKIEQAKISLTKKQEAMKPFLAQFDYYAVPCYDRWDGPEELERYEQRLKHLKEFCEQVKKPAYAILCPTYAPSHTTKDLRGQPIDTKLASEHFTIADSLFEGVIIWQAPENYVAEEIREDASQTRHHILLQMNQSATKRLTNTASDY